MADNPKQKESLETFRLALSVCERALWLEQPLKSMQSDLDSRERHLLREVREREQEAVLLAELLAAAKSKRAELEACKDKSLVVAGMMDRLVGLGPGLAQQPPAAVRTMLLQQEEGFDKNHVDRLKPWTWSKLQPGVEE
jgi:hypothetical protein